VFFQRPRQLIASKQESFLLSGKIETDESFSADDGKTDTAVPQRESASLPPH
jgi:hypothetical protein